MPTSPTPPIRTITLGIAEHHPISNATIEQASATLHHASTRFIDAGYEIQTVRLSTRSIFDDLSEWSSHRIFDYTRSLQQRLDDVGIGFCSLGTAQVTRPGFPLERLDNIVNIVASTTALNMTVQLATIEHGLREEAAIPTAHVMQRLAHETEEGFGNFRFAMLACVEPGSPFFPSAYHIGPANLSLGLQGASIVMDALQKSQSSGKRRVGLSQITQLVREALIEQVTPVVTLGQTLANEYGRIFGGVDVSPAPLASDSIAAAMEQCGCGPLGSPGTLAVAAALTAALKSTGMPDCGYNGLMLPVLEDAVLGQRWEEGRVNVHQLLLYSAVCGTGLDTIPLSGDTPTASISHLLLDVATLALRLQKPLSVRLFPVPGKHAGERTTFSSPYLTNTLVKSLV